VFETYWTNGRGVEAMDYSYALMDLTAYGRQEVWENSPANWPRRDHYKLPHERTSHRPMPAQDRSVGGGSSIKPCCIANVIA
jgi:Bacterial protein of unknown function (DUF899)